MSQSKLRKNVLKLSVLQKHLAWRNTCTSFGTILTYNYTFLDGIWPSNGPVANKVRH